MTTKLRPNSETALAVKGTPEVRKKKPFAGGKVDPREAALKGAQVKEANALKRIGEARGLMGNAAPRVARKAVRAALGHEPITPTQASMINSVLDRTVGKAPQELQVGPSDRFLAILQELQDEDG